MTTIKTPTVELLAHLDARITAGMAVLDEVRGPGWIHEIDLSTLDLSDEDSCICGQVFGGYEEGRDALMAHEPDTGHACDRSRWAAEHGFFAEAGLRGDERLMSLEYRLLTMMWEQAVKDRLHDELARRLKEAYTAMVHAEAHAQRLREDPDSSLEELGPAITAAVEARRAYEALPDPA